jgi:hypothetical protein
MTTLWCGYVIQISMAAILALRHDKCPLQRLSIRLRNHYVGIANSGCAGLDRGAVVGVDECYLPIS